MTTTFPRTFAATFVLALFACVPTASAASVASFSGASLDTTDSTPTLKGAADRYDAVYATIKDAKGTLVYRSKTVDTKKDAFSIEVLKKLGAGTYTVRLYDEDRKFLTKSALTVRVPGAGRITVSGIPLLMGGPVRAGSSIPVAYVQVRNTSTATTTLKGFDLAENGPGSGIGISGFETSDDKGGSRTVVGSAAGPTRFTDGKAFVPLSATIAPGALRIFTVKAIAANDPKADLNATLIVDVAGVQADGTVTGAFPLRGVPISITR